MQLRILIAIPNFFVYFHLVVKCCILMCRCRFIVKPMFFQKIYETVQEVYYGIIPTSLNIDNILVWCMSILYEESVSCIHKQNVKNS